jgi:hypothetical protein
MTLISSYGANNSNSYVDFTAANSFITTAIVDSSAWTSASTVVKEAALMEATRDVDSKQYRGERYFYEQKLEFPRQFITDWPWNRTLANEPSSDIEQVRMLDAVQRATCYQALSILRNAGRNYHAERIASGVKAFSESVGPISESATYASGGGLERLYPDALATLQEYIEGKKVYRA